MRARTPLFLVCVACFLLVLTSSAVAPPAPQQDTARTDPLLQFMKWFENLPPDMQAVLVPAVQKPVGFSLAFGSCGDPCIIDRNHGGLLPRFQLAAMEVRWGAKSLVVMDGPCASGCAVFADLVRHKVCITRKARFRFHMGRSIASADHAGWKKGDIVDYFEPPQSSDIDAWVKRQPMKYPVEGFTEMPFSEAKRFWKECELHPPLPRPRPAVMAKVKPRAPVPPPMRLQAHGLY